MHFTILAIASLFLFVPFAFGSISICPSREITSSSGYITSPNYPSNYSGNTDCTLKIKQPLDTNFTFIFTEIDIESDEFGGQLTCYDILTISHGKTTQEFCGKNTPAPFTLGYNVVALRMQSDGSVQQTGFNLSFTTIKATGLPSAVNVCPTRTITPSANGRVHSPGFADHYGPNLNCKLTLDVPTNKALEITNIYADIEPAGGWVKDMLTIGSIGIFGDDATTTWYSGNFRSSRNFRFENGDVWIRFTTDGSDSGQGFILTYKLMDKTFSTVTTQKPGIERGIEVVTTPKPGNESEQFKSVCAHVMTQKPGNEVVATQKPEIEAHVTTQKPGSEVVSTQKPEIEVKSKTSIVIIFVGVGVGLAIVLIVVFGILKCRRQHRGSKLPISVVSVKLDSFQR